MAKSKKNETDYIDRILNGTDGTLKVDPEMMKSEDSNNTSFSKMFGKQDPRIHADPIGSTRNSVNDAQNSFVSVYGCPVETPVNPLIGGGSSRGVFDQYLIPPHPYYGEAGIPFMSGYGMHESTRIKRIKDLLTVTEYEILMSTTVFSPQERIIEYKNIISKLIHNNVFDDEEVKDDGSGDTQRDAE